MITDSETESLASKDTTDAQFVYDLNLLRHQNKRLKEELSIYKEKVKKLEQENKELKVSKCAMQAKVEVEEEFITNSLLRQISSLKKNMESVKYKFEREEECIIHELTEKLQKLENDKSLLEKTIDPTQQSRIEKLNRRISKLENETKTKQKNLDQLRLDKGDIQNALEQEQEALLNRLWRNISQAEAERILISEKIDHQINHAMNISLAQKRNCEALKSCSLKQEDLQALSMEDLTKLVMNLQRELKQLQSRSSTLEPEKYKKLLRDCNITEDSHWIKQKIQTENSDNSKNSFSSINESVGRDSVTDFRPPSSRSYEQCN